MKKCEAEQAVPEKQRLPITPHILRAIKRVWEPLAADPDIVMLWAACCVAFFGFLRIGEMSVPDDDSYDPAVHLSRQDIALDDASSPSVVRVRIKQSKTDPFRKGIDLYLGKHRLICVLWQHYLTTSQSEARWMVLSSCLKMVGA